MGGRDGVQRGLREGRKRGPHLKETAEGHTLPYCQCHRSCEDTGYLCRKHILFLESGTTSSVNINIPEDCALLLRGLIKTALVLIACTFSLRVPRAALVSSDRRVLLSLSCFTAIIVFTPLMTASRCLCHTTPTSYPRRRSSPPVREKKAILQLLTRTQIAQTSCGTRCASDRSSHLSPHLRQRH